MRFAVIPTHNRPECLQACLDAAAGQVDIAIVIDNASSPPVQPIFPKGMGWVIIGVDDQPPNLSALWNIGIRVAEILQCGEDEVIAAQEDFFIAIINDDVIIPAGWYTSMIHAIEDYAAVAACTDPLHTSGDVRLYRTPITSVHERMVGWAFVLDGAVRLRADENLRWWYGDNAIDLAARKAGGMAMVPGPVVINTYANTWTNARPELAEQAGRDRAYFEAHYQNVPW